MKMILFLLLGFVEWFASSQRMWLVSKGEARKASLVVLVENLLAFFVLFRFVENVNNWPMAIAYSLGASLGTFINLKVDI